MVFNALLNNMILKKVEPARGRLKHCPYNMHMIHAWRHLEKKTVRLIENRNETELSTRDLGTNAAYSQIRKTPRRKNIIFLRQTFT